MHLVNIVQLNHEYLNMWNYDSGDQMMKIIISWLKLCMNKGRYVFTRSFDLIHEAMI